MSCQWLRSSFTMAIHQRLEKCDEISIFAIISRQYWGIWLL